MTTKAIEAGARAIREHLANDRLFAAHANMLARLCVEAAIASGELVPASAVAEMRERCELLCAAERDRAYKTRELAGKDEYLSDTGRYMIEQLATRQGETAERLAKYIRDLEPASGEYVSGWRTMDSAPKDGQTWILIADDHCWPPDLVRWESERPARRTIDGYSNQKIPAGWFMSPGGRSRFDVPDGHLMKATRWHPLTAATSNGSGK